MTECGTYVHPQSEKGNRYAITALKDRRATLAGEIQKFTKTALSTGRNSSHTWTPWRAS
jgi:hypothetical protein